MLSRRQQRERLIRFLEQGTWAERMWLPLVRLVHRLAAKSDARWQRRHLTLEQHQALQEFNRECDRALFFGDEP